MLDRVGQYLGNYRLVRLLGQGGFADVYLQRCAKRMSLYITACFLRVERSRHGETTHVHLGLSLEAEPGTWLPPALLVFWLPPVARSS